MKLVNSLILTATFTMSPVAFAGVETSTKEVVQDVKKEAKKAAHRVEEKACETVNGKLECAGKKIKNRASEVKEEVKDMAQ